MVLSVSTPQAEMKVTAGETLWQMRAKPSKMDTVGGHSRISRKPQPTQSEAGKTAMLLNTQDVPNFLPDSENIKEPS